MWDEEAYFLDADVVCHFLARCTRCGPRSWARYWSVEEKQVSRMFPRHVVELVG